jgi:hypothetical protein
MDYIFILEKQKSFLGVGVLYQPQQVGILRCDKQHIFLYLVEMLARSLTFMSTNGNIDHISKSLRGFE